MDYAAIGKMIRFLRKEQKISQTKLVEGIMDRSNLVKIEKGEQRAGKETMDLLFNRLGYSAKRFFPYPLTEGEFKAYEYRYAYNNAQAKYDTEEMTRLVNEMENMKEFKTGLLKQNLLKNKALLCLRKNKEDYDTAMALYNEAIQISIPNYNPKFVHTYLLGSDDHEIIANMALILFETGEREQSIEIMQRLAENVRNRIFDTHDKTRSLTFVLYNLSRYLGQTERYQEALDVCNEAIEAGEKNRVYEHLPQTKFNKAYCLYYLSQTDGIKDLLYQAYYGALTHGRNKTANDIKNFSLELFNIEIGGY
jgi:transcriptional regulator with XRE-family HTH domain